MGRKAIVTPCLVALLAVACAELQSLFEPVPSSSEPGAKTTSESSGDQPRKCLSFADECQADTERRVRFGEHGASFVVPEGWTYAQEPGQTAAVSPDGGGLVAYTDAAGKEPEQLWDTLAALARRFQITGIDQQTIDFTKPDGKWMAGALEVKVWQVEKPPEGTAPPNQDPVRKGAPGALLVTVTEAGNEVVMGLGFLSRNAPRDLVPAIKASIESLQVAP